MAKIVQIAVAMTQDTDGTIAEQLYALDSSGQIWQWNNESNKYTAGWSAIDLPWNSLSIKKKLVLKRDGAT